MQIQLYTKIDQLKEIRTTWQSLLAETPHASFFQSLPWLQAYWRHFGEGQQLRVLEIAEGDRTIGIVPLVIRREKTRVGPIRYLTYPLDYWGSFYRPLGQDPVSILAAGLSYLAQLNRDWDVLELRGVGVDANDCRTTQFVLSENGLSPVMGLLDRCAIVELSGTWDAYLAGRGSKWRNNLRRWRRRLEEAGEVRYERYRSDGGASDPRWDLFEACLSVARRSWQGSSESGTTISHDTIGAFIRDAHQAAADFGCIDMNLVYLDESPVGFAYNYHYHGNLFGLRIGYDASLKALGIGNVLYANIIKDSFARGDGRYDLGPGSLEAKKHLHTNVVDIYRMSCFQASSLRQQLLRWKRERDAARLPLLETPLSSSAIAGTPGLHL